MTDEGKDKSEIASQLFSPKEFLVYAPAFGTALAIAWEIGMFFPLGLQAFGIFTVTEHLTFALPALPVAYTTLILFLLLAAVRNYSPKESFMFGGRLRRLRPLQLSSRRVGPCLTFFGRPITDVYAIAGAVGAFIFFLSKCFRFASARERYVGGAVLVLYALFFAFRAASFK